MPPFRQNAKGPLSLRRAGLFAWVGWANGLAGRAPHRVPSCRRLDGLGFELELCRRAFLRPDVVASSEVDRLVDAAGFPERIEVSTLDDLARYRDLVVRRDGNIPGRSDAVAGEEQQRDAAPGIASKPRCQYSWRPVPAQQAFSKIYFNRKTSASFDLSFHHQQLDRAAGYRGSFAGDISMIQFPAKISTHVIGEPD